MATDDAILEAARARLYDTLIAGVEEFGEGGERARMIAVRDLEALIAKYEQRVDSNVLRPIEMIDV